MVHGNACITARQRIPVHVLEREECEFGCVFGSRKRQELISIGVKYLDQQIIIARRVAGDQVGYDDVIVRSR